jgi:hypothetical protein
MNKEIERRINWIFGLVDGKPFIDEDYKELDERLITDDIITTTDCVTNMVISLNSIK